MSAGPSTYNDRHDFQRPISESNFIEDLYNNRMSNYYLPRNYGGGSNRPNNNPMGGNISTSKPMPQYTPNTQPWGGSNSYKPTFKLLSVLPGLGGNNISSSNPSGTDGNSKGR